MSDFPLEAPTAAVPLAEPEPMPVAAPTPIRPTDPLREYERAESFKRVAGRRANLALDNIERLINTADRGRYAYNERQTAEIVETLRKALDRLEAAYASKGPNRPRIEL
jgi:hypothetical protein